MKINKKQKCLNNGQFQSEITWYQFWIGEKVRDNTLGHTDEWLREGESKKNDDMINLWKKNN